MSWTFLTGGLLLMLWALTDPVGVLPKKQEPRPADSDPIAPWKQLNHPVFGLVGAALLGLGAWPLQNGVALAVACAVGYALPRVWADKRRRDFRIRTNAAMGQALLHLSTVAHTYRVPYQALSAAVEAFPPLIRDEYRRALQAQEANLPLPDALRQVARRLDDNFYAHQLAELADVSIRTGADFVQSLLRLVQRFSLLEELRAEERTAISGYMGFTRLLAVASVLPLLWWMMTKSSSLAYFVEGGFPKALVGWVVATAAIGTKLPDLLSVDEV